MSSLLCLSLPFLLWILSCFYNFHMCSSIYIAPVLNWVHLIKIDQFYGSKLLVCDYKLIKCWIQLDLMDWFRRVIELEYPTSIPHYGNPSHTVIHSSSRGYGLNNFIFNNWTKLLKRNIILLKYYTLFLIFISLITFCFIKPPVILQVFAHKNLSFKVAIVIWVSGHLSLINILRLIHIHLKRRQPKSKCFLEDCVDVNACLRILQLDNRELKY